MSRVLANNSQTGGASPRPVDPTVSVWSLPALLVAAAVQWRLRVPRSANDPAGAACDPTPEHGRAPGSNWLPRWREGRVWQLGVLLAAASAGFFGTNAYMGAVLDERGRGDDLAGLLFAFNGTQVAGSLLMIAVGQTLVGRRWPVIAVAAGLTLGLLGFALGGSGLLLAAVLLTGLCTCVQLILMVSLVPLLVPERESGALAAGMFAVGYLLGFLVPLAGGVLVDLTGIARLALLPLLLLALLSLGLALNLRLARER